MSDAKEYSVDLGSFYPAAVVDALKAENAKLRAIAEHVAEGPHEDTCTVVYDYHRDCDCIMGKAKAALKRGTLPDGA